MTPALHLRAATLAASVGALAALCLTGFLPLPLGLGTAALVVAGGLLTPRLGPRERTAGQALALLATGVAAAPRIVQSEGSAAAFFTFAAVVFCGLCIAQALALLDDDGVRPFVVQCALAGGAAVLALSLGGGAGVLVACGVALAALLVVLASGSEVRARRQVTRGFEASSAMPWRTYAGPVVAALLATVVAALVVPFGALPHADLPARLAPPVDRSAGSPPVPGGPLDLRTRGDLGKEQVAAVPASAEDHWGSAVHDEYAAGSWTPARDWLQGGAADGEATVEPLARPSGLLLWPHVPVATDARVEERDGGLALSETGAPYAVAWAHLPASQTAASAAEPRWLQVPDSVSPRTHDLAAALRRGSAAGTVQAVRAHVQGTGRYDLDAPQPAPGVDPVDALLFEDRVGFCMQYATAGVVLLRAAGVPARLVTGYAFGDVEDGRRVFRESDAHAWVQAWLPDRGWVDVEVTPAASSSGRGWTGPGTAAGAAGVLLGLAVLVVVLLRRRAREERVPDHPDQVLAAYLRFDDALGERRRGEAETVAAHAGRLPETGGLLTRVEQAAYGPAPLAAAAAEQTAAELDRLALRLREAGQ